MKINIPNKVKVIGKYYSVTFENDLNYNHGNWGETRYGQSQIAIQGKAQGTTIPEQEIEHKFVHELIHSILHEMGEHKLNNNEKFVDLFSNVLYQVLTENNLLKSK
jgi:hypothetical protein